MRSPGAGAPVALTEDEATYCLASLLAASDGKVTHAETRRVESEWLRFAAARGLTPEQARAVAIRGRALRAATGPRTLQAACEGVLAHAKQGQAAILMAAQVAYADGQLGDAEREALQRLFNLVGLDHNRMPGRSAGRTQP